MSPWVSQNHSPSSPSAIASCGASSTALSSICCRCAVWSPSPTASEDCSHAAALPPRAPACARPPRSCRATVAAPTPAARRLRRATGWARSESPADTPTVETRSTTRLARARPSTRFCPARAAALSMKKVSVRGEAEPKPVLGMQEGESCPGAATVHDHAASEDIDLARPCAVAARPHSLPHASLREMRAQRPPLAVFREFESSSFSWAESRGPSSDKIPARSRSSIRAMGIGVLSIVGV